MNGKILLVEFCFRNGHRSIENKIMTTRLVKEGFPVIKFDWGDFNLYTWEDDLFEPTIERAVELSKEMDVVYIHFGIRNFPRGRHNEVVKRFKKAGAKVVVESESKIGLESADAIVPASGDLSGLVKELKRLCQNNKSA